MADQPGTSGARATSQNDVQASPSTEPETDAPSMDVNGTSAKHPDIAQNTAGDVLDAGEAEAPGRSENTGQVVINHAGCGGSGGPREDAASTSGASASGEVTAAWWRERNRELEEELREVAARGLFFRRLHRLRESFQQVDLPAAEPGPPRIAPNESLTVELTAQPSATQATPEQIQPATDGLDNWRRARNRELEMELQDVAARGLFPRRLRQLQRLFDEPPPGSGGADNENDANSSVSEESVGSTPEERAEERREQSRLTELNERRLVSNILESIEARQRLENAVRRMVHHTLDVGEDDRIGPPTQQEDEQRQDQGTGQRETISDVVQLFERHLVTTALQGPTAQLLNMFFDRRHDLGAATGRQSPPPQPAATAFRPEPSSIGSTRQAHALRELSGQVGELRALVATIFDMQVELHRAVRQDVFAGRAAAAISTAPSTSGGQYNTAKPQVVSPVESVAQCLICLDRRSCAVFYQCGHLCTCLPCALKLKNSPGTCPVCRAPIRDVMKCYGVSN